MAAIIGETKSIRAELLDEVSIKKMYRIKEKLGQGSFGKVLRVVSRLDKKQYALKVIKRTKLDEETAVYLNREIEIMRRIRHRNCCRLYAVHKTRSAVYMQLELLRGGDLFGRIVAASHFDERQAARVTGSVARTLEYLHAIGVIHRDLKPDNIMFRTRDADSDVVLADFGLAKHLDANKRYMSSACGTPSYEAPEVIRRKGRQRHYTSQCDMWSLGVVLYAMLSGREPFKARTRAELADKICNSRYSFPEKHWRQISHQAKSLVEGLLVVDPTKRYTPKQVLAHPWIQDPEKPSLNINNISGYRKNLQTTRALHIFHKVRFIVGHCLSWCGIARIPCTLLILIKHTLAPFITALIMPLIRL